MSFTDDLRDRERMPVVSPDGKVGTILKSEWEVLSPQGFKLATTEQVLQQKIEEERLGPTDALAAFGTGASAGLTLGLGPAIGAKLQEEFGNPMEAERMSERARIQREEHPVASISGEVVGSIIPSILTGGAVTTGSKAASSAVGVAGKGLFERGMETAVAKTLAAPTAELAGIEGVMLRGKQAISGWSKTPATQTSQKELFTGYQAAIAKGTKQSLVDRIADKGIRAAATTVEGAGYGAGFGVHENFLQADDATGEHVIAGASMGAIFGGGVGVLPLLGMAIKGATVGTTKGLYKVGSTVGIFPKDPKRGIAKALSIVFDKDEKAILSLLGKDNVKAILEKRNPRLGKGLVYLPEEFETYASGWLGKNAAPDRLLGDISREIDQAFNAGLLSQHERDALLGRLNTKFSAQLEKATEVGGQPIDILTGKMKAGETWRTVTVLHRKGIANKFGTLRDLTSKKRVVKHERFHQHLNDVFDTIVAVEKEQALLDQIGDSIHPILDEMDPDELLAFAKSIKRFPYRQPEEILAHALSDSLTPASADTRKKIKDLIKKEFPDFGYQKKSMRRLSPSLDITSDFENLVKKPWEAVETAQAKVTSITTELKNTLFADGVVDNIFSGIPSDPSRSGAAVFSRGIVNDLKAQLESMLGDSTAYGYRLELQALFTKVDEVAKRLASTGASLGPEMATMSNDDILRHLDGSMENLIPGRNPGDTPVSRLVQPPLVIQSRELYAHLHSLRNRVAWMDSKLVPEAAVTSANAATKAQFTKFQNDLNKALTDENIWTLDLADKQRVFMQILESRVVKKSLSSFPEPGTLAPIGQRRRTLDVLEILATDGSKLDEIAEAWSAIKTTRELGFNDMKKGMLTLLGRGSGGILGSLLGFSAGGPLGGLGGLIIGPMVQKHAGSIFLKSKYMYSYSKGIYDRHISGLVEYLNKSKTGLITPQIKERDSLSKDEKIGQFLQDSEMVRLAVNAQPDQVFSDLSFISTENPDLGAKVGMKLKQAAIFLDSKMPKNTQPALGYKWTPPIAAVEKFNRYVAAVNNPYLAIQNLCNGKPMTVESIEVLTQLYPELHKQFTNDILSNVNIARLPYQTRLSLSKLLGMKLEKAIEATPRIQQAIAVLNAQGEQKQINYSSPEGGGWLAEGLKS